MMSGCGEEVVGEHFPVGQHMDRLGIAEEERIGAKLIELACVARDDQVRTGVRFDGFGQRQAARGPIELVPALARLCGGNRWVEQVGIAEARQLTLRRAGSIAAKSLGRSGMIRAAGLNQPATTTACNTLSFSNTTTKFG